MLRLPSTYEAVTTVPSKRHSLKVEARNCVLDGGVRSGGERRLLGVCCLLVCCLVADTSLTPCWQCWLCRGWP